jgi:two-component system, NarL family, nitrate/nitrite response regulator NarL
LAGGGVCGEINVKTPTDPTVRKPSDTSRAAAAIRVTVFDQSPLLRAGIAHVLRSDNHVDVISVSDTFKLGLTPECDIVIIDASMMMSVLGMARSNQAFRLRAKVLVLAFALDEEQFSAVFAAGASGYLLKRATEQELLEAIHAVHEGEGYVSPGVAATMLRHGGQRCSAGLKANPIDLLSHREGEIFKLLPTGLTNREIGRRLGITENTIKRYFTRIFEKLHVRNRVEAAMLSRLEAKPDVPQRGKIISIEPVSIPLPMAQPNPKPAISPVADLMANAVAVSEGQPLLTTTGRSGDVNVRPRGAE